MSKTGVALLGIFVVDLAFRAGNMPAIGETIAGCIRRRLRSSACGRRRSTRSGVFRFGDGRGFRDAPRPLHVSIVAR